MRKAKTQRRPSKLQRLIRKKLDWDRRFRRAFKMSELYKLLKEKVCNDESKNY